MRYVTIMAVAGLLVAPFVGSAHALDIRSGDSVVIEEGVTVDDDLIIFAEDVSVKGTINGNLLVCAQNVSLQGAVRGSVVACAQTIECDAPIGGSVHAAGQTINVDSTVGRNVTLAGRRVRLGDAAEVRRDAFLAGDSMDASGVIAGDLKAAGRIATLGGGVGQAAHLWIDKLHITNDAHIAGDLVYISGAAGTIADGARIDGQTIHRLPKPAAKKPVKPAREPMSSWVWRAVKWVWILLFTVVLTALLPRQIYDAGQEIRRAPLWALLIGFLFVVVAPVVAVLLLVPMLPGALIIVGLWLAFLYVAKVVAGVFLGSWIFSLLSRREVVRPVLAALLGVIIISALALVPYVAILVRMAVVIFGVGALTLVVGHAIAGGRRQPGETPVAEPGSSA